MDNKASRSSLPAGLYPESRQKAYSPNRYMKEYRRRNCIYPYCIRGTIRISCV